MGTDFGYIDTMNGQLSLTRFYGGSSHGMCVQLTPEKDEKYILLSQKDCFQLYSALSEVFKPTHVKVGVEV